jgi:hypothetical protein
MKNLVICPTRNRVDIFRRFLDSFKLTSVCSKLVAIIDNDDIQKPQYLPLPVEFIISDGGTITELINNAFKSNPGYDFYTVTNDDFVLKTPRWDEILCKPGKISYGNDLAASEAMPTMFTVDAVFPRTLGWLQLPTLNFMYGDNFWKELGTSLHCLKYHKDVINEHMHWCVKKSEIDETYKRTNSSETYTKDSVAFRYWLHNQKLTDVEKIKEALCQRSV